MKYLITGGAGFIGSHLCEALLAAGHGVHVLDDLSTGKRDYVPEGATLSVGDITDTSAVAAALRDVDGCFHLAAIASVARSAEEWLRTHEVNLTGAIRVFDAAAKRGVPVVYASSAATYGDLPEAFLHEELQGRPASAYGADKLGCDLHGQVAWGVHGVRTIGLRFFNVYGPRQDPASPYSGVISIFADRLRRAEALTIHGDGGQERDFIHVADIVRACAVAMAALERGEIGHDVFNVCTGTGTRIDALADMLADALGVRAHKTYGPARPGDMRRAVGSPDKAARVLGYRTAVALADGLRAISSPCKGQD
jgi:UDP-glucose 4-epimerase